MSPSESTSGARSGFSSSSCVLVRRTGADIGGIILESVLPDPHENITVVLAFPKARANLLRELGFSTAEAKKLHATSRNEINHTRRCRAIVRKLAPDWHQRDPKRQRVSGFAR